jgi:ankyrin repeat protein
LDLDIVVILVTSGAHLDAITNLGLTPLHYAAQATLDIVVFLVQSGAGVNPRTYDGNLPSHYAAAVGADCPQVGRPSYKNILEYLITVGNDPWSRNREGHSSWDKFYKAERRELKSFLTDEELASWVVSHRDSAVDPSLHDGSSVSSSGVAGCPSLISYVTRLICEQAVQKLPLAPASSDPCLTALLGKEA